MKKLVMILFLFVSSISISAQDSKLSKKQVFEDKYWRISVRIPKEWKISENIKLTKDALMLIKAETDNSSIFIGVTDYYTEELRKKSDLDRNAVKRMMNEDTQKKIFESSINTIKDSMNLVEMDTKMTSIAGKSAYYVKFDYNIDTNNIIHSEQYYIFDGTVMYTIGLNKTDNSSDAEIALLNTSLSTILIKAKEDILISEKKKQNNIKNRLKKSIFTGVSYVFLAIPIFIVVGLFKLIQLYNKKKNYKRIPDWAKRREKVWKTTDLEELKEISLSDPDESVRDAAKDRMIEIQKSLL